VTFVVTVHVQSVYVHVQQEFEIDGQQILVIGAGGATIPVVHALLKNKAEVSIHNGTQNKITQVIERLSSYGTRTEQIQTFRQTCSDTT
jgi:shikimate 5-dehydrogenase